jgi:signal peptidase II
VSRARALGAAIALAVFVLDQMSKFAVMHGFVATSTPRPLMPFLGLTLQLNPGISFSFFPQQTFGGVALLLLFTLVATALLSVWLWRTGSPLVGAGLGAIIGGAFGNAFDRLAYGAVVDFLDFHAFGRHFFVFNIADAAINFGVLLLLLESVFGGRVGKEEQKGGPVGKPRGGGL